MCPRVSAWLRSGVASSFAWLGPGVASPFASAGMGAALFEGPDGHHWRPLGPARNRSRPATSRRRLQRRPQPLLALPRRPRARASLARPRPANLRPHCVIAAVTRTEPHPLLERLHRRRPDLDRSEVQVPTSGRMRPRTAPYRDTKAARHSASLPPRPARSSATPAPRPASRAAPSATRRKQPVGLAATPRRARQIGINFPHQAIRSRVPELPAALFPGCSHRARNGPSAAPAEGPCAL